MSFRLILNALLLLFKCSCQTALLSYQKEFFICLITLASFVPRVYRLVFGYKIKSFLSQETESFYRYDNSVKTPNLFVVNLDHMLDQVENLVAVAPLVVVPGNQLEEVGVQQQGAQSDRSYGEGRRRIIFLLKNGAEFSAPFFYAFILESSA